MQREAVAESDLLTAHSPVAVLEDEGSLHLEGIPDAVVAFVQAPDAHRAHMHVDRTVMAETDGDGRVQCQLLAGAWSMLVQPMRTRAGIGMFAAQGIAIVSPGTTVEPLFQVHTGTLTVRVLDAEGRPAAGVAIDLLDSEGAVRFTLRSGDDGSATTMVESTPLSMATLPKRLQSVAGESHAAAAARLHLGEVTVPIGQTIERELHLPSQWHR